MLRASASIATVMNANYVRPEIVARLASLWPASDYAPTMRPAFPDGFRFGLGDSDLQVIGERHTLDEEGSEPSMWLRFSEARHADSTLAGVDRFHRWEADLDLLATLGIRHFRTSVSVARVLHRDGSPNDRALAWYRRFLGGLHDRGIRTYVTLYHWELPQYAQDAGGWANRDTVDLLARHAAVVADSLGDLIDEYFTINEPWCAAFLGYHQGVHAPGERSLSRAFAAAHHLLLAGGAMAEEVWRHRPDARLGPVLSTMPCYAMTSSEDDLRAARIADGMSNAWFLDPVFLGTYPAELAELMAAHLPPVGEADMRQIKIGARCHFIGINNYYGLMVEDDPSAELRYRSCLIKDAPTNDLGWPIFVPPYYPTAIYDMLHQVWHAYRSYGLKRVYVSENGMAEKPKFDDTGTMTPDNRRIAYLTEHVERVLKAVRASVPVEAYFAWTFLDNYEWEHGYHPEASFGLVHVDRATMRRTPKASARWFAELARTGDVPSLTQPA